MTPTHDYDYCITTRYYIIEKLFHIIIIINHKHEIVILKKSAFETIVNNKNTSLAANHDDTPSETNPIIVVSLCTLSPNEHV